MSKCNVVHFTQSAVMKPLGSTGSGMKYSNEEYFTVPIATLKAHINLYYIANLLI